jgi:hypothetical protein
VVSVTLFLGDVEDTSLPKRSILVKLGEYLNGNPGCLTILRLLVPAIKLQRYRSSLMSISLTTRIDADAVPLDATVVASENATHKLVRMCCVHSPMRLHVTFRASLSLWE